jgi:phenylpropionate dioxygenase-like ring-hydroxylating dioxygenase large terminal subunit
VTQPLKLPKQSARQYPKPPEGSWTEHHPELGTGPVSYESSISPEFYELERKAIFGRAWLNVGRVEQLRRKGSFFTKELAVAKTSLIVVRGADGVIRAFHNVCRHRGNKLVWTDHPTEEISGSCRQFACKYHGWTYELDGRLSFILQEGEFFGIDKAEYGLVPVHCEVWQGFVFVNLAKEPSQTLTDFLGPMITAIEYPFEKLTQRYYYRGDIRSNWKVFLDAFQEFYHPPILHGNQNPVMRQTDYRQKGFYTSHFQADGPHRVGSTSGGAGGLLVPEFYNPIERLMRSGLFGPWDPSEIVTDELPPGLNPGKKRNWGLDSFQIFPNFAIVFWETGWYLTYHYWPLAHDRLLFEANAYFTPPRNARERLAQQLGIATIKEYALEDCGTLEATQMGLESRAVTAFPLGDQEFMCRHLNKVVHDWVDDYQRKRAEG